MAAAVVVVARAGRARGDLFAALALSWPRRQIDQLGRRREVSLGLFLVVGIGNGLALVALIAALIGGWRARTAAKLLYKAMTIWSTSVIAFGLWFRVFDRGGPVRRREPDPPPPDFQFPPMENSDLAARAVNILR